MQGETQSLVQYLQCTSAAAAAVIQRWEIHCLQLLCLSRVGWCNRCSRAAAGSNK